MAIIKIIPGANFTQQLQDGVLKFGGTNIDNRVALNFKQISSEIGSFIADIAANTDVMKSLKGQGSEDLGAHFGLSSSDSAGLVDGMLNIIRNSVTIGSITAGNKKTITIRAVESDFQKFLELPGASYVSKPSDITIPLMQWMLLDPSIDASTAAYQIVFSGDKFFRSKNSRSGRAIMVSLQKMGGGAGYILPSIISRMGGGANFIENVISQPGIAQKCAEIVIGKIR
jgi:hypothetical protein